MPVGRIGEHHTAGLLDSQAALSLVDLFSWVSRRGVIVRGAEGDGFVSCARSRVRSFARSLTYRYIAGSLSVAITTRLDRMMKGGFRSRLLLTPSSFVPFRSVLDLFGSCMLHPAGDDGKASTASHAGPECCVVHRGSRRSGLRRVDFRSGEGMLGIVWVASVVWCAHVGRRHEI